MDGLIQIKNIPVNLIQEKKLHLFRKFLGLLLIYIFAQYIWLSPHFFGSDSILNIQNAPALLTNFFGQPRFLYETPLVTWQVVLCCGLFLSALLVFNKFSKLCAILIFAILLVISIRNTVGLHLGDKVIFFLLFFYIFSPKNFKSENNSAIAWWTAAIHLQIFTIYTIETYLKLTSGWLAGTGLNIALQEEELATHLGQKISAMPVLTDFLGLTVILMSFAIAALSISSFFKPHKKYLVFIGLAYHLGALFLMRLDWLPIANIIFLLLLMPHGSTLHSAEKLKIFDQKLNLRTAFLVLLLILSLLFSKQLVDSKMPINQNWNGYAPPSRTTATYLTAVTSGQESKQWVNSEFITNSEIFYDLRTYKLFHNMLKQDKNLQNSYLKYICKNSVQIFLPNAKKIATLSANYRYFYPVKSQKKFETLMKIRCD